LAAVLSLTLIGCSRFTPASTGTPGGNEALQSNIVAFGAQPGLTPFESTVQLIGQSFAQLSSVTYSIAPQPGSVSLPVTVTWSMSALSRRGFVQGTSCQIPVFGLYDGYQNLVTFQLTFEDGSTKPLEYTIATQPYTDPTGVYTDPTIVKARTSGSNLGFNFFVLKSLLGSPVIVDTDAKVRWVDPDATASEAAYFGDGQFVIGSQTNATVTKLTIDGTQSTLQANLPQPLLSSFTHNIDRGPNGMLAEFNGTDSLGDSIDDIVAEITPYSGKTPTQTFDMAEIISAYMQSQGDDASAFVRPGVDWFHLNASTYDPSDNTVIISSREDFLIKVNYTTHDIVWILGDPTKYWYTFPSLRAKALTLDPGGIYPVGQHAVSITSDGYVMVFNDGLGSINQPPGAPGGVTRNYSAVSAYSINPAAMTAHEVWDFDYGQSIYSEICGSSYEAAGGGYLVDFATADELTAARLVGLDSNRNIVFDFQYASPSACGAAWNAIPVELENLQIN
jgi:hypothetical protein